MNDDQDIPVLTDAVNRSQSALLNQEQIDELCDSLAAETLVLLDGLISEALSNLEDRLRVQINDRLGDDLPALIEKTLREKLGETSEK